MFPGSPVPRVATTAPRPLLSSSSSSRSRSPSPALSHAPHVELSSSSLAATKPSPSPSPSPETPAPACAELGTAASGAGIVGGLHNHCCCHSAFVKVHVDLAPVCAPGGLTHESPAASDIRGNVLVVEDDLVSQAIIRSSLPHYKVVMVSSVNDAWQWLQQCSFDIVLLDLVLPVDNGYHLIELMRSCDLLKRVPIIIMSGLSNAPENALVGVAADYLQKPIGRDILQRKIELVLSLKKHIGLDEEINSRKAQRSVFDKKMVNMMESPMQGVLRKLDNLIKREISEELKLELEQVVAEISNSNPYQPSMKAVFESGLDTLSKAVLLGELDGRNIFFDPPASSQSAECALYRQQLSQWEFNQFQYSEQDLVPCVIEMFSTFQLLEKFNISLDKLRNWISAVQRQYHHNSYHNFRHAFDVLQCVYSFLTTMMLAQYLNHLEVLALFISALCHDIGHPGLNNNFQINSNSDLALLYNDNAVLENMHASLTFQILSHEELNILAGLTPDQYRVLTILFYPLN
ncbi:cAMP phosphodiesterase [Pelomyxa schiedti]|nr:cAMP phosphodiesterase [Pelomyxa schiedti]